MGDPEPLMNLLYSLLQCFSVIFIGYLAVKFSVITSQASAIGTYVSKFAMPALFFRSIVRMDFRDVNWYFVLGIALGKLILFLITVISTLLITRPMNFGIAGILAIFITQSNAVAIGYPIVNSLYPHLSKYMYLFAPIQFVMINPLCFILLEWHEHRSNHASRDIAPMSLQLRVLLVLKNVIINPLVFMTVAGVVYNVSCPQLPLVIDKVVQTLGNSFIGVALFYLGMSMVGKISAVTKKDAYILLFLLLGKLVFLPFITRELVVHLIKHQGDTNQSLDYSFVAFLYGGLPTSAPVFLIANNFKILPDLIATGIVIGTLISGPLMFINARVITMVPASNYTQLDKYLKPIEVGASVISLVGCIWVLIIFIMRKQYRNTIHKFTISYALFIGLASFGSLIGQILHPNQSNQMYQHMHLKYCIQFTMFFIGAVGTRVWTIIIAASLMIIKRNGISCLNYNRGYFYLIGFCTPVIITAALLLSSGSETAMNIFTTSKYGRCQLITASLVLAVSITLIMTFLILEARQMTTYKASGLAKSTIDPLSPLFDVEPIDVITKGEDNISCGRFVDATLDNPNSLEDNISNTPSDRNDHGLISLESVQDNEEFQIQQHIALVILLLLTMGFALFLYLWRLTREDFSGLYIELQCLDSVFNFGQGFILWAVFGFDKKNIIMPFKKKTLELWHKMDSFRASNVRGPSDDVGRIQKEFSENHLEKCRFDIVKHISNCSQQCACVFTGKCLVTWVEGVGLADNRNGAIDYGQTLIACGVIEHVAKIKDFVDDEESLYRFVELRSNVRTS